MPQHTFLHGHGVAYWSAGPPSALRYHLDGSMVMPVVHVGVVQMRVAERLMAVPVGVGLDHRSVMLVLVVLIMDMGMVMLKGLVKVLVAVPLAQVQV